MGKWLLRVYVAVIVTYLSYLFVVAGVHTVCDCLR